MIRTGTRNDWCSVYLYKPVYCTQYVVDPAVLFLKQGSNLICNYSNGGSSLQISSTLPLKVCKDDNIYLNFSTPWFMIQIVFRSNFTFSIPIQFPTLNLSGSATLTKYSEKKNVVPQDDR